MKQQEVCCREMDKVLGMRMGGRRRFVAALHACCQRAFSALSVRKWLNIQICWLAAAASMRHRVEQQLVKCLPRENREWCRL